MNARAPSKVVVGTVALVTFLFGNACLVSATDPKIRQVRPGKLVKSPLKNFRLPAPDLGPGTRLEEMHTKDGGYFYFASDFGLINGIRYNRLLSLPPENLSEQAREKAFENAFSMFREAHNADLLGQDRFVLGDAESFYALVAVPGGSPFLDVKTGERGDSLWSIAIFWRGEFLYTLISGSAKWPGVGDVPRDRRMEVGKKNLRDLFERIEFL